MSGVERLFTPLPDWGSFLDERELQHISEMPPIGWWFRRDVAKVILLIAGILGGVSIANAISNGQGFLDGYFVFLTVVAVAATCDLMLNWKIQEERRSRQLELLSLAHIPEVSLAAAVTAELQKIAAADRPEYASERGELLGKTTTSQLEIVRSIASAIGPKLGIPDELIVPLCARYLLNLIGETRAEDSGR